MIPSPQDLLTAWMQDWQKDLDRNLHQQAELQEDERRIRAVLEAMVAAGTYLFPPPPAPTPEPTPAPTEPPIQGV